MIALAGPDAAALLAELHARAFDAAWSETEIARLMQNPAIFTLLASQHAPDGFVMAWAAAGESEVLTLAVDPRARRRGVATALMQAAMAAALVRGAASMALDVAADNEAARALYARLDFAEVGGRPRYYQRPDGAVDALVLRRALPRALA